MMMKEMILDSLKNLVGIAKEKENMKDVSVSQDAPVSACADALKIPAGASMTLSAEMTEQQQHLGVTDVNTRIAHQKQVADTFLKALHRLNPSAICAGGAPLSWHQNTPANDIDLYIHYNLVGSHAQVVRDMLVREIDGLEFIVAQNGEGLPEHYKHNPALLTVLNYKLKGEDIQVMVMNEPTYNMIRERFPVSSSMIWYKYGRVHTEDYSEFHLFTDYKIQLVHDDYYDTRHTNTYMKKIMERYPEKEGYIYFKRSTFKDFVSQFGTYYGYKMEGMLKGLSEGTQEGVERAQNSPWF